MFQHQPSQSKGLKSLNPYLLLLFEDNPLSLNLKAYYSDGEEVGPTKKGDNFIKGTVNCTMIDGTASFDKLYPREVSKKL